MDNEPTIKQPASSSYLWLLAAPGALIVILGLSALVRAL